MGAACQNKLDPMTFAKAIGGGAAFNDRKAYVICASTPI
jgi:hypothetical protein